jgi:hypothetical protein
MNGIIPASLPYNSVRDDINHENVFDDVTIICHRLHNSKSLLMACLDPMN